MLRLAWPYLVFLVSILSTQGLVEMGLFQSLSVTAWSMVAFVAMGFHFLRIAGRVATSDVVSGHRTEMAVEAFWPVLSVFSLAMIMLGVMHSLYA